MVMIWICYGYDIVITDMIWYDMIWYDMIWLWLVMIGYAMAIIITKVVIDWLAKIFAPLSALNGSILGLELGLG